MGNSKDLASGCRIVLQGAGEVPRSRDLRGPSGQGQDLHPFLTQAETLLHLFYTLDFHVKFSLEKGRVVVIIGG